jgi:hypothetical protein
MKPTVQRLLGAGGARYFPTHSPVRTHDPLSNPFRSKSSRVVIFTISGGHGKYIIVCIMSEASSPAYLLSSSATLPEERINLYWVETLFGDVEPRY